MKKKILIVDDQKICAIALQQLLQKNYDTTMVHSGEEAVEAAKASCFDLVLLDISMPGLDGFQTKDQLRLLKLHLLIIAVTARNDHTDQTYWQQQGFDGYLYKGLSGQAMLQVIEERLTN